MTQEQQWIACQVGFRDHYLVPRVLREAGVLHSAFTEMWVRPGSLLHRLGGARLRERYHPELADAPIHSWNYRTLAQELRVRAGRASAWQRTIDRNHWFQRECVRRLEKLQLLKNANVTLFAYNYAARRMLEYARSRGWRTVLGQIDPGQYDERLMIELYARHAGVSQPWTRIPEEYWSEWRRECELADRIVVDSEWSRDALVREAVAAAKIQVIPLAYESAVATRAIVRERPTRFTSARPLRVLSLGYGNVRKGIVETLEALELLGDTPVDVTFVGPISMTIPRRWQNDPRVHWAGYLPRSQALERYGDADVFLFPSHSDGFGLTQLEAQAHGVPLIASPNSGRVVEHEKTGLLLPEVSGSAIAAAIRRILDDPSLLARVAESGGLSRHSKSEFATGWLSWADTQCLQDPRSRFARWG